MEPAFRPRDLRRAVAAPPAIPAIKGRGSFGFHPVLAWGEFGLPKPLQAIASVRIGGGTA
jgi:hypothetical protein